MIHEEFNIDLLPYAKVPSENWKNANEEAKKDMKSKPDDIIHAYNAGVDKGMNTTQQVLLQSFQDNIKKAFSVSEEIFKKISSEKFNINNLFLKANNIASFDVLFIVKLEDYLSDVRKEAYKIAREAKKEKSEKLFDINFSFMANNEGISHECLNSDGYIFRYEASTRQA